MSEKSDDTTTKSGAEAAPRDETIETKKPVVSQRETTRTAALEAVKSRREELAGATATEKAAADKSTEGAETKEAAAAGDAQADAGEGKVETKARIFTTEDIAKPGFFDSLDKEGWAALEKQHPLSVALYKSGKADLTRLGQKLKDRAAALDEREAALTESKDTASTAAATAEEEEELKALGFTPADVEKLLGSKAAQRVLGKLTEQTVKSMGVDPEREEAQIEGFKSALDEFPELEDNEVWKDVQQKILGDPKESKALDEAKNPEEIARILRAATGRVVAERAKSTRVTETKEEKKREKETANATKPVSRAIGKPRVAPTAPVDVNAPMSREARREVMRQWVADEKAKRAYKELR